MKKAEVLMTEKTYEKNGGKKMIPKMHIIPWDPKALKQEVARIVRSFSGREEFFNHQRVEEMMQTMHVTPWDSKALKLETERIVRSYLQRSTHSMREE